MASTIPPLYTFNILDNRKKPRKVILPVPYDELIDVLATRMHCIDVPQKAPPVKAWWAWHTAGSPPVQDYINCYYTMQRMLNMIKLGTTVDACVFKAVAVVRNIRLKNSLLCVYRDTLTGIPLSKAMEAHPEHFNASVVGQVAVGEETKKVSGAFGRMASSLAEMKKIRGQMMSSCYYPIGAGIFMYVVLAFLLGFVMPKLATVFKSMQIPLPWVTKVILAASAAVKTYPALLASGPILVAVLFATKSYWVPWLLALLPKIPKVGDTFLKYEISQSVSLLSTLIENGVKVHIAAGLVGDASASPKLKQAFYEARALLETGSTPNLCFDPVHYYFGPVSEDFQIAVEIGSASNTLGESLAVVAQDYRNDFMRVSEAFTKLLEPVILVMFGIMTGTIAMAVYYPIITATTSIK